MKRKRSDLWNFFEPENEKSMLAICNICKAKLSFKTSTSNLKKHMTNKHPTVALGNDERDKANQQSVKIVAQVVETSLTSVAGPSSAEPSLATKPVTEGHVKRLHTCQQKLSSYLPKKITFHEKKDIDSALLGLFTDSYQPFRIVEEPAFKKFVSILNPTYELPSRFTISKTLIPALYEKCRTKLSNKILNEVQTCCLTTDCWSSINNESYIAVTIHFINNRFQLESALLACSNIQGPHTTENLTRELRKIISEWNLKSSQISLAVSDNAYNIVSAIKDKLSWKHLGCLAHTINLVVTDGLKNVEITAIIIKIKSIVSHFKKSNNATEKLLTVQRQAGNTVPLKLFQDCPTRWNSTFYMIKRFLELEEAVKTTIAVLNADLPILTISEWKVLKELVQILQPFESATRCLSGDNYATASLVIPLVKGINAVIRKLLNKEFSESSQMVLKSLNTSLNDRLKYIENSATLSVCTYLDPRFKHKGFAAEKNSETAKKKVIYLLSAIIEKDIEERELENKENPSNKKNETGQQNTGTNDDDSDLSIWGDLDKEITSIKPKSSASSTAIIEVQRYLEADFAPRQSNPLAWWNENKFMFKYLPILVRQKLCNLATSVPCERQFSKAGLVISDRRSRLSNEKVKMILFIETNQKLTD